MPIYPSLISILFMPIYHSPSLHLFIIYIPLHLSLYSCLSIHLFIDGSLFIPFISSYPFIHIPLSISLSLFIISISIFYATSIHALSVIPSFLSVHTSPFSLFYSCLCPSLPSFIQFPILPLPISLLFMPIMPIPFINSCLYIVSLSLFISIDSYLSLFIHAYLSLLYLYLSLYSCLPSLSVIYSIHAYFLHSFCLSIHSIHGLSIHASIPFSLSLFIYDPLSLSLFMPIYPSISHIYISLSLFMPIYPSLCHPSPLYFSMPSFSCLSIPLLIITFISLFIHAIHLFLFSIHAYSIHILFMPSIIYIPLSLFIHAYHPSLSLLFISLFHAFMSIHPSLFHIDGSHAYPLFLYSCPSTWLSLSLPFMPISLCLHLFYHSLSLFLLLTCLSIPLSIHAYLFILLHAFIHAFILFMPIFYSSLHPYLSIRGSLFISMPIPLSLYSYLYSHSCLLIHVYPSLCLSSFLSSLPLFIHTSLFIIPILIISIHVYPSISFIDGMPAYLSLLSPISLFYSCLSIPVYFIYISLSFSLFMSIHLFSSLYQSHY
ncbi:unnamed protein product [Acanthosepion pharaonis]|uniref:Uncharacterized protein n=1 Tax=Acanthosepion pharaonis TaxID=158019 RepID=A0A812AWQ5_ACAPH|nr:unnamed protein product [Sepia pharaonis]